MRNTAVEAAPSSHVTLETRLHGRWRLIARGVWIVLGIVTLAIFFASLPVYLTLLQTPCLRQTMSVLTTCEYQQLTPGQVKALTEMGVVYTMK